VNRRAMLILVSPNHPDRWDYSQDCTMDSLDCSEVISIRRYWKSRVSIVDHNEVMWVNRRVN
jgi:hypothetical protein